MLCEFCKKKEATVHYTKIVGGEIEELHLCDECARNHGEIEFDSSFSFHKLLTGLIDNIYGGSTKEKVEEIKCSFCGLDYSRFRQSGKFGCARCYETFKSNLIPLFKGINGHTNHVGKAPKSTNETLAKERKIQSLKAEMARLVAKEAFEEAAIIRDQIRELEKELDS